MSTRHAVLVIIVGLLVAVGAATASIVLAFSGSDSPQRAATGATAARLDDPGLVSSYVAAATAGVQAVTSYDYRSLPDALSNGLQVTTGAYRASYRQALTGDNAASVVRGRVVQTFDLLKIGIGKVAADGKQATVLVFGIEHKTNSGGQQADPLTLTATLQKVGDRFLISRLEEDASAGVPPGNAALRKAAEAGRHEVVNLLSFTRAQFAADQQRALDGATAGLRADLVPRLARTKAAMNSGKYDLTGAVTAVAIESVAGDRVAMLIAATGERISATGTKTVVTDGRFAVSVALVGGDWLIEQVSATGTS